jgi:hypothetical protein
MELTPFITRSSLVSLIAFARLFPAGAGDARHMTIISYYPLAGGTKLQNPPRNSPEEEKTI